MHSMCFRNTSGASLELNGVNENILNEAKDDIAMARTLRWDKGDGVFIPGKRYGGIMPSRLGQNRGLFSFLFEAGRVDTTGESMSKIIHSAECVEDTVGMMVELS